MALTLRLVKGSALSYAEGDDNFTYLLTNMSGSNISITGSTGILGSTTMRGTSTISNPADTTSFTITDNGTTTASDTVMQFTSSLNGFRHIKGTNSGSGSGAAVGAIFYNNNNDFLQIYQACTLNTSLTGARTAYIRSTGTALSLMADNTSCNIRFFTFSNSSERMRIDSSGNVGINITSPTALLHVVGTLSNGNNTTATGSYSHAEGELSQAKGDYSHAEGYFTVASGAYSHAEGDSTQTLGAISHAEGWFSQAIGAFSHAEGVYTTAIGQGSHAEGSYTYASGTYSHAEGTFTSASGNFQHVQGTYNLSSTSAGAFIIGNGTSNFNRSNLIFASGSQVQVTGSVDIIDVLVLPFQNPLPSNKPTGSVAISGSGGTFVGMFVYNGTTWTNVKA